MSEQIEKKKNEGQTETVEEKHAPKSTVYGPVASWRLGRSLGIDMLCTEQRTCNFDCVYCQLPPGPKPQVERQEFVSLAKLVDDLNAVKGTAADWVTFSGMGEPTLAANLGDAISMAKSILGLPVAVLTNGGLISHKYVRMDLAKADMVIGKLDANEELLFRTINRPSEDMKFSSILRGWQLFRMEYKGKLAVSIMLNDLNKCAVYDMIYKAQLLVPDQIQLNTPINSSNIKSLSVVDLKKYKTWLWNMKDVINVYDAKRPEVAPLDAKETELRHPDNR